MQTIHNKAINSSKINEDYPLPPHPTTTMHAHYHTYNYLPCHTIPAMLRLKIILIVSNKKAFLPYAQTELLKKCSHRK